MRKRNECRIPLFETLVLLRFSLKTIAQLDSAPPRKNSLVMLSIQAFT